MISPYKRLVVVATNRSKLMDKIVLDADFKVYGKASGPKFPLNLLQFSHRIGLGFFRFLLLARGPELDSVIKNIEKSIS